MSNKREILAPRRSGFKSQNLPRYLIVVDTEQTEYNYLNGLKNTIPRHLIDRIDIQIKNTNTDNLVEYCLNMCRKSPNYVTPWIVFDRDRVVNFDKIIYDAQNHKINVAWSNPCIETWFFSYYDKPQNISESTICVSKFKEKFKQIAGQEYKKNDKNIYKKLNQTGSQDKAIKYHEVKFKNYKQDETLPSEMFSCSTMYMLISELLEIISKLK